VKDKLTVGVHTYCHDGNISVYDHDTNTLKYLKFERITGYKGQAHDDLSTWVKYLNHLGYDIGDITNLAIVDAGGIYGVEFPYKYLTPIFVDHHLCHHHSIMGTSNYNSLIVDSVGSSFDCVTIYKKNQPKLKLNAYQHSCLGRDLDKLWMQWFTTKKDDDLYVERYNEFRENLDFAGHTMALHAFGKDYSHLLDMPTYKRYKNKKNKLVHVPNTFENLSNFKKKINSKDESFISNSFVTSLHYYWYKKLRRHLSNNFNKHDKIGVSGGVGHNIILNTMLKEDFPNYTPTPHCGDEGLSIGAVIFLLGGEFYKRFRLKQSIVDIKQHDENFGYAKHSTIKKVAKYLDEGKIVMWGQGWGELGPRALGYRSILFDPTVPNAKEILNDKIKKRIWFRPYGASVPVDDYENYFDLKYESPWMLYQAKVKDPWKYATITHADGTCRIQTVDNKNPTFLNLLKEFKQITGSSVLINTSMNLPGKPIIGTKKQAKIMFDKSEADVLVMGDEIHTKLL